MWVTPKKHKWFWENRKPLIDAYNKGVIDTPKGIWLDEEEAMLEHGILAAVNYALESATPDEELSSRLLEANYALAKENLRLKARMKALGYKL